MTRIESMYTDFRAWFRAEMRFERDPKMRDALAAAIVTCNRRIAQARARAVARRRVVV